MISINSQIAPSRPKSMLDACLSPLRAIFVSIDRA